MSIAYAESLERLSRWSEAGEAWRAIAERQGAAGKSDEAADAAGRAADAFRRDDRPAAAARAIRLALHHRQATVRDAALLAAALGEAGELEAAADIASAALDGADDEAARVLALDVATGSALSCGRVPQARAFAAELARSPMAGAALAAGFREAQLARLDGDLARAIGGWRALVGKLAPHPAAAGAMAAAYMEIGETQVLRLALRDRGVPWYLASAGDDEADEAETEACFVAAGHAWARAGRRSGLFRAEAWKLRLRDRGSTIATAVDSAIGYADDRGLVGMSAELRCLRAVLKKSPLDALHAVELLRQAPLARGRARVIAAELGAPLDSASAHHELMHDLPWRERLGRAGVASDD